MIHTLVLYITFFSTSSTTTAPRTRRMITKDTTTPTMGAVFDDGFPSGGTVMHVHTYIGMYITKGKHVCITTLV